MPAAKTRRFLAIDLGAESGRGMLAVLSGGEVALREVHRFPNEPVRLLDTLHWDVPRLFLEIRRAIARAAELCREEGGTLDGIGIDTWGVDYALLGPSGDLLAIPVHYRDSRLEGILERVLEHIPKRTIFEETGLQFIALNTLFQLAAERERTPHRLERASTLLMMPDLFVYFLTGRRVSERTVASTTQLWNARRNEWSSTLLKHMELTPSLMPEVLEPGTIVGTLHPELARELDVEPAPPVIATASHDTAAAIAAVPVDPGSGDDWAYLSSGTWSLMGIERREAMITEEVLEENFTNEAGVGGTYRILRNLMGLWIVQESRRHWERRGESLTYEELTRLASGAEPLQSVIVPEDPLFYAPGDMPQRVREYCRRSGQPEPEGHGAMIRCILESLALSYRDNAARIARITGKPIRRLHIVGGGSRNEFLNQLTADALGVDVIAGPAEATALGNALMQAVATGALGSVAELRRVVHDSFGTESYRPADDSRKAWDRAAARFAELALRPIGQIRSP